MSWDEVQTRLAQEARKRTELASYRLGLGNGGSRPVVTANSSGSFFFSRGELRPRTALLQRHLGSEVAPILQEADEIMSHRFRLLGYEDIQYGPEIDWHLDAVHGKRSPLKPWFRVRFLDFAEVGDHKITWELNRHQHLLTLAKAWRFTGKNEYVDELIKQWYSWQAANPYPIGINWSSSLEVAFRTLSWLWVLHLLADVPSLPADFEMDVSDALALNAGYIERYLSTYFSPNTHLLGEATALFFVGTLCPQFRSAQRWRERGWQILLREAQHQVRPDGVYFEQSLYYHVYALDLFLHARLLATRNGIEAPAEFDAVLKKMLGVLDALSRAGPPIGFGDDDGGRLFDPRRNRSEHLTDPLAIGALSFGQRGSKRVAVTEEAIWLFGDAAISSSPQTSPDARELPSIAFPAGGIYVLASSEVYRGQVTIDAGPQGTSNSGHGHADALAVQLCIEGQPWLIDSGTFAYMSEERNLFRGTGAHNTLRVDGADQAVPAGPFAWNSIPTVLAETWIAGETFALFAGKHDGYKRLPDPVTHSRIVFHLYGNFWLVRDLASGKESHALETFWHFPSDVSLVKRDDRFITTRGNASGDGLTLLPAEDSRWSCELITGQISPAYGKKESAPVLRCSAHLKLPAEYAMLLSPTNSSFPDKSGLRRINAVDPGVVVYRCEESGNTHVMIFANASTIAWTACGISSDARFLYFRVQGGRLAHFILCRGKSMQIGGHPVLRHNKQIERFEWLIRAGIPRISSSDEGATNSWSGNAVGLFDSLSLEV